MKKLLKWIAIVLLSPVLLFVVLGALLYVPPIQNWVAQRVTAYASAQTGMQITLERVSLSFPLDLGIEGLRVVKGQDTIADIGRTVVDVQLLPLLSSRVVLNRLELNDAHLNTLDIVSDLRLQGAMGRLSLAAPNVDLQRLDMVLSAPTLQDADLTVYMSDTAAVDTSTVGWHITFDRLRLERSRIRVVIDSAACFQQPQTNLDAYMGDASLHDADLHLGLGRFRFGQLDWQQGLLGYGDQLQLCGLELKLDSLYSYKDDLRVGIAHAEGRDCQNDWQVDDLRGVVAMDGEGISLKNFEARTPYSSLTAQADLAYAALESQAPIGDRQGMNVAIDAAIGREDLEQLDIPSLREMERGGTLQLRMKGNIQQAEIEQLTIDLPGQLHAEANGQIGNLMETDRLTAQLNMNVEAQDAALLAQKAGLPAGGSLPKDMAIVGDVALKGGRMEADLKARATGGTAQIKGWFDQQREDYDVSLDVNDVNVRAFLPQGPLGRVTATVSLEGHGTDFTAAHSRMEARLRVDGMQYDGMAIDSIEGVVSMAGGHVVAALQAANSLVDGCLDVVGQWDAHRIDAEVDADFTRVDLTALGIANDPTTVGLKGHINMNTDLALTHQVEGKLTHIYISDAQTTRRPKDMVLTLSTSEQQTRLSLQTGDLTMRAKADGNYEWLADKLAAMADTIATQMESRTFDQQKLKQMLPEMKLYMESRQDNPVADLLRTKAGMDFKHLFVDLDASPQTGLNGQLSLYGLNLDSTRIDTIRLNLVEKTRGLTFNGQATNNRRNPQMVFNALFDGVMQEHGASFGVRLYDDKGLLGLRLGAKAEMVDEGISFHLIPQRPTLGYKAFALNDDNFLLLGHDQKLQAKVDLVADDGTGLKVYSENQDSTMLQDLTISIHQLDLGRLSTSMPFLPRLAGVLNGDYHLTMNRQEQISVASDMEIVGMAYEGSPMGDIGTEFVYLQREDDTHAVEAVLMRDSEEIGNLRGSYQAGGRIDALLNLTHMPLEMLNGFVAADGLFGFEGFAEGEVSMKGTLKNPKADGELYLSEASLVSKPYGVRLRFDDDPVRIVDSRLLLENFTMYAQRSADGRSQGANDNPLNIMGNIDFHDTDHMTLDLRMRADNFQLINAKQAKESVAYGKMFINLMARLNGDTEHLQMRGKLDVLGTTDLNYILLDSPLSTDNQLDELVKFTDFSDTTQTVVERPAPDGLDLNLTISIDEGAHVRCDLNAEQTNYVDLFGGGDLRMRMNGDELGLTGRYTVSNGTMKYSLPVIPLKTFTIQQGSYVEFTGDPANPTLNLTATERTKAAVGQEGAQSRSVAFDCGVVITKTLADMGLEFTISAPEDLTISSELASMSAEQRGKLAVTMLTTGMYLADGSTGSFSMNSALSSFLQSEINQITGNALKTLDLSIGLDNTTDASGQMHTDYSFKFAKRFWNNRLKVQIGGKVSTGSEVEGQNQSFFDNVTMEYRLSPTSNQYVKLFYNQNVYDWLEGYTGEYGAGYIWRRKLDSLKDLFRFKTQQMQPLPMNRMSSPFNNGPATDSIRAGNPLVTDTLKTTTE